MPHRTYRFTLIIGAVPYACFIKSLGHKFVLQCIPCSKSGPFRPLFELRNETRDIEESLWSYFNSEHQINQKSTKASGVNHYGWFINHRIRYRYAFSMENLGVWALRALSNNIILLLSELELCLHRSTDFEQIRVLKKIETDRENIYPDYQLCHSLRASFPISTPCFTKLGICNLSPHLRNIWTTKSIAELRTNKSCGTAIADLQNLIFPIPQFPAVSCQFRYFLVPFPQLIMVLKIKTKIFLELSVSLETQNVP